MPGGRGGTELVRERPCPPFRPRASHGDTADGVLMTRAYGWAFLDPVRRIFYKLATTSLSVAVALLVLARGASFLAWRLRGRRRARAGPCPAQAIHRHIRGME
ncbi:MAG: hypothetical protein KGJ64_10815, partial [Betaproteobacteria bacterium]|nr:hypothetical protein [Betaproteobacteria bacterium]